MTALDTDLIQSYHAHVYYDAETKETAARRRRGALRDHHGALA